MRLSSHPATLIRGLAILILLLACLSLAPQRLFAQSVIQGSQLDSGEVIDNDVVMNGDEVVLAGTVKGNAFITGRDIVIDGTIEGSLFAIGQRVTLNGSVDGSAYVIAVSSRLNSTSQIGQNLYFVGVSLVSEPGSQVGRDMVGLTLGAILQGSVGRDTKLIAGLLQFANLFFDFALGPSPMPSIAGRMGRAPGLGQFILPGEIVFDVVGQTVNTTQLAQPASTQDDLVADWFLARLREFLPLLIIGLIGYWFRRRSLEETSTVIKARPLPTLGLGLVGLVLSGAIVGALLLVFVLIIMTGIWIGQATFWNLSSLLWSIAIPFTALVLAVFLAFLNYGTKVIASYAGATFLFDRFAPRAGRVRWLLMILGLVVYVLLRSIPILGWVISILVTAWGIGAAWTVWRNRRALAPPAMVTADIATPNPDPIADEAHV